MRNANNKAGYATNQLKIELNIDKDAGGGGGGGAGMRGNTKLGEWRERHDGYRTFVEKQSNAVHSMVHGDHGALRHRLNAEVCSA